MVRASYRGTGSPDPGETAAPRVHSDASARGGEPRRWHSHCPIPAGKEGTCHETELDDPTLLDLDPAPDPDPDRRIHARDRRADSGRPGHSLGAPGSVGAREAGARGAAGRSPAADAEG